MKRKKLDYEKLRRKFPSMNKISSRLASFLEYGEYLTYTNEEIRNMFLSLLLLETATEWLMLHLWL